MAAQEPLIPRRGPALSFTLSAAGFQERLTVFPGITAMVVGMVGTGAVAFPYGFALCGSIGGPVVLGVVAVLSQMSYNSLINMAEQHGVASYGALTLKLPKTWDLFGKFALWGVLVLSTSAYVIISADIVKSIVLSKNEGELPFLMKDHLLFGLIILVVLPLCLLKSMRGLSTITSFCTFALIGVICLLIYESLEICSRRGFAEVPEKFQMTPVREPRSMVLAAPIFGTAMFGHMNVCQIYSELKRHLKERASHVALSATVITYAIYCVIAYAGYVAFGASAEPDIMKQIASEVGETTPVLLAQSLLAGFIILKSPLLVLPARQVTFDTINPGGDSSTLSTGKHVALTLAVLFCVYFAAVSIPDLGKLLAIVGAVSAIPIVFIVPARLSWQLETPRRPLRCVLMGTFGVVISLLSLGLVFGLI